MITHSVYFRLHHGEGSKEEAGFFTEIGKLQSIPTVREFHLVDEISPKNNFRYGLVITFENREDFDTYNNHPDHQWFVENVWMSQVAEFMEIDYVGRSI